MSEFESHGVRLGLQMSYARLVYFVKGFEYK